MICAFLGFIIMIIIIGTDLEDKSVVQTVISAARDPSKVLAFNYASEALNNSFFLETLVRSPNSPQFSK